MSNSEWDRLVEEVEKIECDLPDIGFMIEFAKIWNPVKDYWYLMESQANEYTSRALKAEETVRQIRKWVFDDLYPDILKLIKLKEMLEEFDT